MGQKKLRGMIMQRSFEYFQRAAVDVVDAGCDVVVVTPDFRVFWIVTFALVTDHTLLWVRHEIEASKLN